MGIRVATINISTGSTHNITLHNLTLSKDSGIDYTQVFANLAVYRNGIKVGTLTVTPDKISTSELDMLLLAGEPIELELRADIIYKGLPTFTTFKIRDSLDISASETYTGYDTPVNFPLSPQSLVIS